MILCKWCASDEYVDYDTTSKVAVCSGPGHPTERMWEPAQEIIRAGPLALADGIAAELGLYDDLPACLAAGEWAETGVVEHRYGTAHPKEYQWMINRWGHVAQGSRRYSVTSFIGSTLAALSRATNIAYKQGRGTGFYAYNSDVGMWTLRPVDPEAT